MANNWQPKVGEWVVLHRQVLLVQKRDDKTTILQDWDKSYQEVFSNISLSALRDGLFRPAVLDDFAVTIPDYGKVWFVKFDVSGLTVEFTEVDIQRKENKIQDYHITYDSISHDKAVLTAVVSHYNITVMSETLFKQLSEVRDAD